MFESAGWDGTWVGGQHESGIEKRPALKKMVFPSRPIVTAHRRFRENLSGAIRMEPWGLCGEEPPEKAGDLRDVDHGLGVSSFSTAFSGAPGFLDKISLIFINSSVVVKVSEVALFHCGILAVLPKPVSTFAFLTNTSI